MKSVLITGFEPFDHHTVNPSQLIAERLSGRIVSDARVVGLTLPVEWGKDRDLMFAAIADINPAVIHSFGLDDAAPAL